MAHSADDETACTSLGHGQSSLGLDTADNIWHHVKDKVASALCGPGVTAVPHLRDARLFRPLCVIGKRVERSLRMRKVRSLFPLGPLQDLLDDPGPPAPSGPALFTSGAAPPSGAPLRRQGPVRCDFLHEEFLDGVGRVRVQVGHVGSEAALGSLAPHRQLVLRDNLPWLDSVHRLYLVSQAYYSSDLRLRVLGTDRRTELRLGPDTPLAFSCLRLSVSPSGLVEVCEGWGGSYLHPQARWARFGSPDYHALTAGRPAEPRTRGVLSQFAVRVCSTLSSSAVHLASGSSGPHHASSGYQVEQEISTQALLPTDDEEEEGS